MYTIQLKLKIELQSKWHCGSGEGGLAINRAVKRDSRNWPYIPATTLRGIVRENCEKLCRILQFPDPTDPHEYDLTRSKPGAFQPLNKVCSPVDELFGNRYEGGCLFFRDAGLNIEPDRAPLVQSRICKYRKLGTARDGHLFSTEYISPQKLENGVTSFQTFETSIDGYHNDPIYFEDRDPPFAYCLLIAGILSVDRIGSDKSSGCGRARISIDSARYNDTALDSDKIFEYLRLADLYRDILDSRGLPCSLKQESAEKRGKLE